jgi:hypothetical protein
MFRFQAGAGAATLEIDPLAVGANLDLLAELYDSSGTLIEFSNPVESLDASFALSLPVADSYFLRISGTGKGDPLSDGYTDYGSLGHYRITGTIPAYTTGNVPPVAVDDQASTVVDTPLVLDVLANDTDANGDPLALVSVTQSNRGSVTVNANETVTYNPASLFLGEDTFRYTIRDGQGGSDTATVTVTVTEGDGMTNPGFEEGLTGWEPLGDVSTQTDTIGGVLDAVAPGTATAGSAIRRQLTAVAGQQLSGKYNFATNESTPDGTYNDFSFFTVAGPGVQQALLLADTNVPGFQNSASSYKEPTGYGVFSYTFPQTGTYTIGFGVSDSHDTAYNSALLIDDLVLGSVRCTRGPSKPIPAAASAPTWFPTKPSAG